MVNMSEIYKIKKKALVRGAGDLATGVGVALHRAEFQVIMTDIAVPLTVRREVAMSRAVYEGRVEVEGIEGILVKNYREARQVLEEGKIAVIVDPEAEIRKEFRPDVLVDAILAKRNTGTSRTDAPYVIGLGPGFTAGKDVHAVIETMRGTTLADIIYDGQPIPNTGVPGYVGGYALERLIRASGTGRMEPKAQIGDIVRKGQLLAVTGGEPVYSQLDGVIRGMLQEGVQVKKGLKIGDVDPRKDKTLCYLISDKANKIGSSVVKAAEERLSDKEYAMILLAAGKSSRYGDNKLLEELDGGRMFEHTLRKMRAFPLCTQVVVTRFDEIANAAKAQGMLVAENREPDLGIAHSLKLGLKKALEENPGLKGAMFIVCDQPGLTAGTFARMLEIGKMHPGKIVCAGRKGRMGNPVLWDQCFFEELGRLSGDKGGKQIIGAHKEAVVLCETEEAELQDVDVPEQLRKWERDYGESGKSGEET